MADAKKEGKDTKETKGPWLEKLVPFEGEGHDQPHLGNRSQKLCESLEKQSLGRVSTALVDFVLLMEIRLAAYYASRCASLGQSDSGNSDFSQFPALEIHKHRNQQKPWRREGLIPRASCKVDRAYSQEKLMGCRAEGLHESSIHCSAKYVQIQHV